MLADLKDRSSFVKWNNDNHREDIKAVEKTSLWQKVTKKGHGLVYLTLHGFHYISSGELRRLRRVVHLVLKSN